MSVLDGVQCRALMELAVKETTMKWGMIKVLRVASVRESTPTALKIKTYG